MFVSSCTATAALCHVDIFGMHARLGRSIVKHTIRGIFRAHVGPKIFYLNFVAPSCLVYTELLHLPMKMTALWCVLTTALRTRSRCCLIVVCRITHAGINTVLSQARRYAGGEDLT